MCVGGEAVLYVVRQQLWEKSDNRAHVKGGTSSNTAFRLQAVHKQTNHPFTDLYPAHFDHVFFSEQQVTAVSAFCNLPCHFLYFIGRQSFLWSCLCNADP